MSYIVEIEGLPVTESNLGHGVQDKASEAWGFIADVRGQLVSVLFDESDAPELVDPRELRWM